MGWIRYCLDRLEERGTLIGFLVQGAIAVAGFGLPAWAVRSMSAFAEYQPLSWVIAGFGGLMLVVLFNLGWQWARRIRVRASYDARLLASPSVVNPLDRTFEGQRIYINDFALPSWTWIEGKTFIDCEIIGPANLYWFQGNLANQIKPPRFDVVYLDPGKQFFNGFLLKDCIFRNCSFQRITLFVGHADYETVKGHEMLNWISLTPEPQGEMKLISPDPVPATDIQQPASTATETQQ